MGAFPQYSKHEFAFSTESYGGHYGPIFNEFFETQNSMKIPGAHRISLESLIIGYSSPSQSLYHDFDCIRNGWYDPLIQYQVCDSSHRSILWVCIDTQYRLTTISPFSPGTHTTFLPSVPAYRRKCSITFMEKAIV